jgi:Tol biopolymer transport system component
MGIYAASPSGKGHLLFARYGALMAQAFDPDTLELSGDPWTVEEDVMNFATEVGATAYGAFSVSQNGTLLFRSGGDQTTRFAWFDREGKEISSGSEPGIYREPRLSPDGKRIAYVRSTETGEDIHVLDIESGTEIKLTFDSANDVTPVWSPDGNRIVFGSSRDGGTLKLYERFADGSGGEKFLYGLVGNLRPDDFTPDGSTILFDFDSGAIAKNDLMLLPAAGGEARPYLQTPFVEAHATFSPDGRWVAYTSDENGKLEVFVQSYPVGRGKWLVSTRQDARTQSTLGGDHPQWSRDGHWLFYLQPDRNLIAVPVNLSGTFSKGNPERLFETKIPLMSLSGDRNNFLVSPDGQRFFINNLVEANNTKPLTLVLNWESGVQR